MNKKRNARISKVENKSQEVGKRTKNRIKNERKNLILNILLIVFIVVFIYSSYHVFMWIKSDRKIKKLESGLYKDVVEDIKDNNDDDDEQPENPSEDNQEKATYSVDFKKLKEINKDVIGWIKINGTYINYPILQGKTDEYYLKKDIYKSYDYSGSIFVYSNVKPFIDENTVIFGHNMNNHRMFAHLKMIHDGELGKNIDVEICTEETNHIYKVFSCYIESPNLAVTKNSFTEDQKREYIDNAIEKSDIDFNQEVLYSKKIITLITCGATSKNRIIVHAVEE